VHLAQDGDQLLALVDTVSIRGNEFLDRVTINLAYKKGSATWSESVSQFS